ncbi:hypothetical protein TRICI_001307 [Trichomonascus ciferrii]|uniref:DASH complex subunit DUO1 n=1 Tax=Trichomonascus ciferrii TaxID=44093 RepID=A0A642V9U8_9ASCO|nr:hypothetical protein TRICI_001307 [Trichomonascus ciferrii]
MADINGLSSSLNSLKVHLAENNPSDQDITPEERQQTLEAELEQVRQTNDVMDGVNEAIEKAENDLDVVLNTVQNTDKLLDMWVKILSQTEHTQKLLFDSNWQGLTRDDELQAEREAALARKREQERILQEKRQQQDAIRRKKEEEMNERRRLKEETMQRRIYGKRGPPSSTTATRPQSRSVSNSSTTNASTSRIRPPTTTGIKRNVNGTRKRP